MAEVIRIRDDNNDSRFSRFELIGWWDQARLAKAHVLVIGAGALGNEILKNLALLGVGNIFIADLDTVENSNLSRSVLFRESDCGRGKAEVAAERVRDIYPDVNIQAYRGNIVYDLGLGLYRWADVIIGGLDNREARVAMNQSAARAGRAWIDGAIERLDGVARVFDASTGPCYECTMSEVDWKMLAARRSCALLSRSEMETGKVPTTPTTASVVAGIQCQEAVKLLHGLKPLSGQGFVFEGTHHQSYVVEYMRKADCPAHEAYSPWRVMPWACATTRVGDVLEQVRCDLGAEAVIELNQDVLAGLRCESCREDEPIWQSLGKVSEKQGRCPTCGQMRAPHMFHTIDGQEAILDRSLASIGVPLWDVIGGRAGLQQQFYEFAGDREAVLGPLA